MNTLENMIGKRKNAGQYILFCLAGGLLGWLLQMIVNVQPATVMAWMGYSSLNEVAGLPEAQVLSILYPAAQVSAVFFSALLSCGLVYGMSVAEMKTEHTWKEATLKSLVALPLGLVIGAATGYLSEIIFEGAYGAASTAGLVLLHGLGWGIIGIGIALAVCLTARCWKKMIGSLIAGLLGGFIAGVLFGLMSLPAVETSQFVKLVGILILGLLIGIGLLLIHKFAEKSVKA